MITGAIRSQIDQIWNAFRSGGIANPLEGIEQITYLLFIRRLDDLHTLEESKANRLKQPMARRIFPEGKDAKGRSYEDFRWSRFKHFAPADLFTVVGEHLFPYLRADLALFLRLLKPGGRAAVIVPDGVLFGSSKAHKELRRILVEDQKLDAVVSLPGGVVKPYAGVSTEILVFTKTNSGGTDFVWFDDVQADGWSLDDKRTALLPEDKLGPVLSRHSGESRNPGPTSPGLRLSPERRLLTPEEHVKNNLPDVLACWADRNGAERERPRTAQSFCVPKADIAAQGYDLSLNRYKEVVHEAVEHRPPKEILAELAKLEEEIQRGMKELEGMLG